MRRASRSLWVGGIRAVLASVLIASAAANVTAGTSSEAVAEDLSAVVRATGEGAMPTTGEEPNRAKAYLKAKTCAKLEAIANLVQATKESHVQARLSSSNHSSESEISQEIDGVIEKVRIISERTRQHGKDTIVEVTVQAELDDYQTPFGAGRASADKPVQIASAAADASWIKLAAKPAFGPPARAREAPYTSVIIDTTGLGVKRSMAPKILRSNGAEVWGTVKVSYDFVADHGIVAYARSLPQAFGSARAGDNPLVIRAVARGPSPYGGDAVISDEDADYLLAENAKPKFLAAFRVIFVVDASRF